MDNKSYPEHDKLMKIRDKSQEIGFFIDWLISNGFSICEFKKEKFEEYEVDGEKYNQYFPEGYYPINKSIDQWLAEFFGIDLTKLEDEKRQMLDLIRRSYKD